jgi:hypothetical protein
MEYHSLEKSSGEDEDDYDYSDEVIKEEYYDYDDIPDCDKKRIQERERERREYAN